MGSEGQGLVSAARQRSHSPWHWSILMIEFNEDGDLFGCGADMIVNPVNCEGVMGGGLALAFQTKFPGIMTPYLKACREGTLRPGIMQVIEVVRMEPSGLYPYTLHIANFPTKDELRYPSKIEYVRDGLPALRKEAEARGVKCLAIPALGCGLGGLNWGDVKPLIEDAFKDYDGRVIVFLPK